MKERYLLVWLLHVITVMCLNEMKATSKCCWEFKRLFPAI